VTDARESPVTIEALVDLDAGVVFIPVSTDFLPLFVDRWMACRRVRMSARSDGVYDLEIEDAET
jgi:hypothetical protein